MLLVLVEVVVEEVAAQILVRLQDKVVVVVVEHQ
jgi:hypothetical protein